MVRNIFHGSDHIIEKPIFGQGKPYNDYGLGFYCTESIDMAKEWAVGESSNGFANCYTINCKALSILNLCNKEYSILHWLTILLENREFDTITPLAFQAKEYLLESFHTDYREYDCIIGYRADDSYFSFAQDFLSGAISYQQLRKAMYLGELGEQIVLVSRRSFLAIRYIGSEKAFRSEWLVKKTERDRQARAAYLHSDRMRYRRGELYAVTILDEEIKPNDPRLA
jgi:hypothetical protein